jgi:hypothetical protein
VRALSGLSLAVAALSAGRPAQAQNQRSALAQVDRAAAQLSSDSGLTAALHRYLRPDGVLLWPKAPMLIGDTEVLHFSKAMEQSPRLRLTWQSVGIEFSQDSALAVLWGVALAAGASDTFPPRLGRFIAVWRREPADHWGLGALLLSGPAAAANASAGPRPSAPSSGRTDSNSVYQNADRSFAQMARDSGAAIAFRTWAAADAMTFGATGLILRGRDNIGRAVTGPERWTWRPVVGGGSGDLGWTAGEATIQGTDSTATYSKYLTIWRRSPGQPPRFILDAGNPRPGP